MMDDEVNVSEADAQEPGEHRLGEGQERLRVDMKRACTFRRRHGIAGGPIVEGRQDDEVGLTFQDLEDAGYGERVHAHRHVLAMVFEHP
jgi:hypothetical protein